MTHWYVLYTKPNKEKKVLTQLEKIGIKTYCPMTTSIRQWSDRKKKIQTPLIARVIFIDCLEADRSKVFEVPGAQYYLLFCGKPAMVPQGDIEKMQDSLNGDITKTNVQELKSGDSYTLENHGFSGQKGTVQEVSKNRIQILLKELGMKITITK